MLTLDYPRVTSLNITTPTKIQSEVYPLAIKCENVIGVAPTGAGKTLAFLLPILQKLDFSSQVGLQAIIIAPTREINTANLHTCKFI